MNYARNTSILCSLTSTHSRYYPNIHSDFTILIQNLSKTPENVFTQTATMNRRKINSIHINNAVVTFPKIKSQTSKTHSNRSINHEGRSIRHVIINKKRIFSLDERSNLHEFCANHRCIRCDESIICFNKMGRLGDALVAFVHKGGFFWRVCLGTCWGFLTLLWVCRFDWDRLMGCHMFIWLWYIFEKSFVSFRIDVINENINKKLRHEWIYMFEKESFDWWVLSAMICSYKTWNMNAEMLRMYMRNNMMILK